MPLYLRKLPELYGDTPVRDLGYMASEGRGATPLVNSGAGGVLNVTSHFFEFVPEEERDDPDKTFLTADQLESNREYYIYFTTSAGLYRYDINDVVRVVDWYRRTPVIQFVRKGQGMTSITGEKLTESQVTGALLDVLSVTGYEIEHFTACVEWGEPPRYAFYAEARVDSMTPERERAFAGGGRWIPRRSPSQEHRVRGQARVAPPGRARAEACRPRHLPGDAPEARRRRSARGAGQAAAALTEHGVRQGSQRDRGGARRG